MKQYKFIELKEKVVMEYIFDMNLKEFLFKYKEMEDIASYIFELKDMKYIRKF